ncbi:MAG: hypothetical protein ACJ75Q_00575 [Gaiellaceae bacterium]
MSGRPGSDPGHAARRVSHDGWDAEIDVAIALLVLELWRNRVGTMASCQDVDGNGRAWVRCSYSSASRWVALLGEAYTLLDVPQLGHGPAEVYFDLDDVDELVQRLRAARRGAA